MKKIVNLARPIFVIAGLLLLFMAPATAATITVCSSGCNYTSIQDAVNHAVDGDTIEIYSGEYDEAVIVNRSITLTGIDTGTGLPVIDASGAEFGVTLESPDILLYRLNITGANSSAILMQNDGAELLELMIVHHKEEHRELTYPAVTGENITDISISACTFDVLKDCVALYDPDDYSITGNTFSNPTAYSVAIISSGSCDPTANGIISGNSIAQKRGAGIGIVARAAGVLVENLTIADNTISGSGGSIGLFIPSSGVVIRNNTLQENPEAIGIGKGIYGIMTYGTSGVEITENHAYGTDVELPFRFEDCSELEITGNTVDSNSDMGMGFIGITNSTVSGNTMDNNVYNFWMSPIILDPGEVPGNLIDQTNLADGKPIWYFEATDDLSVDSSDNLAALFLYACDNAHVKDVTFQTSSDGVMALYCENATITNCSFQQLYRGIMAVMSPHLTIQDNHFTGCFDGMMVGDFYDGQISGNLIENCGDSGIVTGIYLEDVEVRNNVIDTALAGLYLDHVSGFNNAVFDGNTIRNTLTSGVASTESKGAVITGNNLELDRGVGFDISWSSRLNITGNALAGAADIAFLLYESPENIITSNYLSSTEHGFILERKEGRAGCFDNLIANNRVNSLDSVQFCLKGGFGEEIDRKKFGVEPMTPLDGILFTTLLSEGDPDDLDEFSCNPDPSPPANTWNVTKSAGPNIVDGPFIGGNYWAKPDGTGWSQVTPDRGDGFCNAPFVVNAGNTDYLPLHMHEGEIEITAPAVIDSPGRYRLVNDLVNSTVDKAILISSSDVYFDGDGHTLGGAFQLDTSGVLAENNGLENITIANLTVTGWETGIGVNGVADLQLQDIQSTGNNCGFGITDATGVTIDNCSSTENIAMEQDGFYYGGIGITLEETAGTCIIDSNISHNGWGEEHSLVGGYGILSNDIVDLAISGCTINGNANTGVHNENSRDSVVTHNQIHHNGGNGGIFTATSSPDPVVNCTITDNAISGSEWGIWLEQNDHAVRDNTVTGCEYGILLSSCRNASLTGNAMAGNDMNFIVDGQYYQDYLNWVDTTNTVDGRPIYYLIHENGRVIDSSTGAGIVIGLFCEDLIIRDLSLSKNPYGVFLIDGYQVEISNVTSTESENGFVILGSDYVSIEGCCARANTKNGFWVNGSDYIEISGSDAVDNYGPKGLGTGVTIFDCYDVIIRDVNACNNNFAGIDMEDATQGLVQGITADSNGAAGIIIGGDDIAMRDCFIRDNGYTGIGMYESDNVSIWNNYLSNDINADFATGETSGFSWNVTKTPGLNIVDGPFIGGNYWAKPDGTGWSQVTPDRGDGFCNAPFVIDSNNTDYLPLHTRETPPFYADFTAEPVQGDAPLTVRFTDESSGDPIQYLYDFGDGFTSRTRNPTHLYRTAGEYTVTQKIWKLQGTALVGTSTVKEDFIRVQGEPTPGLSANFSADPHNGTAPLSVAFTDMSTGNPVRWNYNFGDGTSSAARNPVHVYRVPGSYNVSLTVFALDGTRLVSNTTEKVDLVTVEGTPVPDLMANFTADPLDGTAPLSVAFTDTSTGNPVRWNYNFGDGTSSAARNPVHVYRVPGSYNVSLTVFALDGTRLVSNTTEKVDLITVDGTPIPELLANFTAEPVSGAAPLLVEFTDASTGDPKFWKYDFGDGFSSNSKNPGHTYRLPGTYTVKLTVTGFGPGYTLISNSTTRPELVIVQ